MFALRYSAVLVLIVSAAVGFFVYTTTGGGDRFDFKFGLDLSGGTQLVYRADISKLPAEGVADSLATLREVIERRVNAFGVGEPLVQTVQGGVLGAGEHRLIVELPGITDIDEAVRLIGETPLLEFKLVKQGMEAQIVTASGTPNVAAFTDTGLTGEYLSRAALEFNSAVGALQEPTVRVDFNAEGAKLFSDITSKNIGRELAIFLDGNLVSAPVIRDAITNGTAIISGNFTPETARELVRNLNLGALPVPIELASSQTIGATLGEEALRAGIASGVIGFLVLAAFMILWYRLPGVIAVVALVIYVGLMLALFKLIPVVLTAAGIAGFILSVGLAVDANILIAERLKEELAAGKKAEAAIREGFARAWLAIRDSNIAHIIAAVILFWFGTSLIKGFALVFGLGVVVSMLSAITISRTFLLALGINMEKPLGKFLMRSGLKK
ncbi:protein-export membrane protein SecD [Candidatus Adlerbacteria bacterium RIFCSPLOWO2_01_FULL_51_16]|uniref:Protein translocase subunit SecD n=1 Tax=Candidatus Adlerbacteria bacterium RIFCSPLOWO2_01_FULL_51_16 TaxID=1797243 RepID=A0A1F4XH66_9BACT|nr:MAG: protein-export membrane protein SecD [Candidatus Adlerbacteria bacterium RIFCSPLOWO2_01_FULL_51_16]